MGEWLKAIGGPLAVVVVGLSLSGFRTDLAWLLVAIGIAGFLGRAVYRRLPGEIRPKRSTRMFSEVEPEVSNSITTPSLEPKAVVPAGISPIAVQPLPPGVYLVDLRASPSETTAPMEQVLVAPPMASGELSTSPI
jgi:hypothetical protein